MTYQLQHNSVMLVYVMEFKKLCFQYRSATFLKSSLSLCSLTLFNGKVGTVIDKASTVDIGTTQGSGMK